MTPDRSSRTEPDSDEFRHPSSCPFCGSGEVAVTAFEVRRDSAPSIYAVLCRDCGARGPTSANWDVGIGHLAATILWNSNATRGGVKE